MFTFLTILTIIAYILLLIVAAVQPKHSRLNRFELDRRSELGDKHAIQSLEREKMLGDVVSLQRVSIALLQVLFFVSAELAFGMVAGIFAAIFAAFSYGSIARLKFIKKLSCMIYEMIEKSILKFIKKYPTIFKIIRSAPSDRDSHSLHIDSRQELQHIIAESDGVLTPEEKKLIVNSLSFNDKLVKAVMTPRDDISYVKKSEYLGPLALDELHKTGHSRLPVIGSSLDHVVGILHMEGLLALDTKRSTTAEKAMEKKVFYVNQNKTLAQALVGFLNTKHYLHIVVNDDHQTVGMLTLKDIIQALVGHQIADDEEV